MFKKKKKFCFAILCKTNMYCATAVVERFDLNQFTTEMSFIRKTKKLRTCLYRVIKINSILL